VDPRKGHEMTIVKAIPRERNGSAGARTVARISSVEPCTKPLSCHRHHEGSRFGELSVTKAYVLAWRCHVCLGRESLILSSGCDGSIFSQACWLVDITFAQ